MPLLCVPIKSLEAQTLKNRSGLGDFDFKSLIRHYATRHDGKLPQLDELRGANSEPALKEALQLTKRNFTDEKTLLELTGKSDFNQALIELNNQFRDLLISGKKMGEKVHLVIEHRPALILGNYDPKATPINYVSPVTKVISGGQTGMDTIGLEVGLALGKETGGTVPPGFLREDKASSSNPEGLSKEQLTDLMKKFGLKEITKEEQAGKKGRNIYNPRTEKNVVDSDGTIYFTVGDSPGLISTRGFANRHNKPFLVVTPNTDIKTIRNWLTRNNIKTLNVAGNRLSTLNKFDPKQAERFRVMLVKALNNENEFLEELLESQETQDTQVNMTVLLNSTCDRLAELYGITIHSMTAKEISEDEMLSKIPGVLAAKAFIFNGNIYINTDHATPDSKLHELLHLIFGSVKFTDAFLYTNMVEMADKLPSFLKYFKENQDGRSAEDIREEFIVSKLAEYLSGQGPLDINVSPEVMYQVFYNMNRLLDSVFMGTSSVKAISSDLLYNYSIREVARMVDSAILRGQFKGSMDDARMSRVLANVKEELIRKKELTQECK